MSIKAIREAVQKAKRDGFANGVVIQWTSKGSFGTDYLYAAIKSPAGWFTTARRDNPFVDQVVDFNGLLEIIARPETTDVKIASQWLEIDSDPDTVSI